MEKGIIDFDAMANGADDAFLFSLLFTLLPLGSRVMCPSLLLLLRQGARSRLALCEGFIQRGAEREEENVKIVPHRPLVSVFFFLSFASIESFERAKTSFFFRPLFFTPSHFLSFFSLSTPFVEREIDSSNPLSLVT